MSSNNYARLKLQVSVTLLRKIDKDAFDWNRNYSPTPPTCPLHCLPILNICILSSATVSLHIHSTPIPSSTSVLPSFFNALFPHSPSSLPCFRHVFSGDPQVLGWSGWWLLNPQINKGSAAPQHNSVTTTRPSPIHHTQHQLMTVYCSTTLLYSTRSKILYDMWI